MAAGQRRSRHMFLLYVSPEFAPNISEDNARGRCVKNLSVKLLYIFISPATLSFEYVINNPWLQAEG